MPLDNAATTSKARLLLGPAARLIVAGVSHAATYWRPQVIGRKLPVRFGEANLGKQISGCRPTLRPGPAVRSRRVLGRIGWPGR